MGSDRGLPSIPRNIGRDMRVYLQGLHSVVASLAGLARNSQKNKAVRYSDDNLPAGEGSEKKELITGAVQTRHLADFSVTTQKMADRSVTSEKLAPGALKGNAFSNGAVDSTALADESVTTDKLANRAVTQKKLGAGAVTTDKLADSSVTAPKLADSAVTGKKIANNAVTAEHIASGAVGTSELAAEVLPVRTAGTAANGQAVSIGAWHGAPDVALTGFSFSGLPPGGSMQVGIQNLRKSGTTWSFTARAYASGTDAEGNAVTSSGQITWAATGMRASNAG